MLQTLLWDDEVREARFPALEKQTRITDKELDMSSSLVDSLSDDFEPADFSDDYQEELRQLIDAKLEEGESLDTDATFGEKPDDDDGEGGEVIDLMEALRQSVEKNRSGGHRKPTKKPAASGTGSSAGSKEPAAKEPAAKEPAAKKPAAKKRAAKKPAAKSSTTTSSRSGGAGTAAKEEPASSARKKRAAPEKKAS
jgi:DNA end-binding protein Ku